MHPGLDAVLAFARFLRKDGIKLAGGGAPKQSEPGQQDGQVIASVRSVTLAEMVQWMLEESNNMIAETLARHVAIAPASRPLSAARRRRSGRSTPSWACAASTWWTAAGFRRWTRSPRTPWSSWSSWPLVRGAGLAFGPLLPGCRSPDSPGRLGQGVSSGRSDGPGSGWSGEDRQHIRGRHADGDRLRR